MTAPAGPGEAVERLGRLVARLRGPDGCPWDREQTIESVRAYLVEEAHEVAAAIDGGDRGELAEELGDLLFQVVFVAHLGAEEEAFDLATVADGIHAKMVERHPHVFAVATSAEAVPTDAAGVRRAWERRKAPAEGGGSHLDGVPATLPALTAAYRLTQKAAGVGFDWPDAAAVVAKVREELAEVEAEVPADEPAARQRLGEELGDLLFAVANLARHHGVDPESALAATNRKFRRRFAAIEATLAADGRQLADADLAEMDAAWEAVKRRERESG